MAGNIDCANRLRPQGTPPTRHVIAHGGRKNRRNSQFCRASGIGLVYFIMEKCKRRARRLKLSLSPAGGAKLGARRRSKGRARRRRKERSEEEKQRTSEEEKEEQGGKGGARRKGGN